MNTITTSAVRQIDFTKLNRVIKQLEALCDFKGQQVIEQLQDYEGLPFIDLLIKTGIEPDELQLQLEQLLSSGVIKKASNPFCAEYCLNFKKLSMIAAIAKILAKN